MEDRPENPDLPILLRKAYLTWNEVDGLLFHHAYKRNAHSRNYKWTESLKNARKGVRDLFEEALFNGELKGESSTRGYIPIYQKIKKGELCAWLMGKRILDLLEDKVIEVPAENVEFIEKSSKEKPQAVPEPNAEKHGKAPSDPSLFIQSLIIYCENDIEIKIQAPTKQPITCNPDSLGFRNKETNQWKYLIGLLQSAGGTFSYSRKEGTKKSAWREIEKKLRAFLNSKFGLNLTNDFKLFSSTQEAGVRKPIFQIHKSEDKNREDFSTLGKDQIAEKIRELSISPDTKTADLLNKAVARAEELGFSQLEMVGMLKTDDFLPSEISSLYNVDSTLLIKDRPDIDGKQQKPERNRDDIED